MSVSCRAIFFFNICFNLINLYLINQKKKKKGQNSNSKMPKPHKITQFL